MSPTPSPSPEPAPQRPQARWRAVLRWGYWVPIAMAYGYIVAVALSDICRPAGRQVAFRALIDVGFLVALAGGLIVVLRHTVRKRLWATLWWVLLVVGITLWIEWLCCSFGTFDPGCYAAGLSGP